MNQNELLELGLSQVDKLGYQLRQWGVTDKVNRHNLAAELMFLKHQLEGEKDRWTLKGAKLIHDVLPFAPRPLKKPLEHFKQVLNIS